MQEVVIVSACRTPFGHFQGALKRLTAPKLGGIVIKSAVQRAKIDPNEVQGVILGQVLEAGCGMGPARQAVVHSGLLSHTVPAVSVNKVCASGIKSIITATLTLMTNHKQCMVAGGMESMSNAPFYLFRYGEQLKYGGMQLTDAILHDGLVDPFSQKPVGFAADATAKKYGFTRQQLDDYAIGSYRRTAEAYLKNVFKAEYCEVKLIEDDETHTKTLIDSDEEYCHDRFQDMGDLPPAFPTDGEGVITAGNSCTIADGAAAVLLMTAERAKELDVKPLARILGFADAETAADDYCEAPSLCIPKILDRAGLKTSEVSLWEVGEAFSVVPLLTIDKCHLPKERVNTNGGAISIGHPLGASATRLVVHLCNVLKSGEKGVAVICNGGGGSSGIALQKL